MNKKLHLILIFVVLLVGFSAKKPDSKSDLTWIMKSDGAKKCEAGVVDTLKKGVESLAAEKITVFDSKKKKDGKFRVEMCGAPAGSWDLYLIRKEDVRQAEKSGFTQLPAGTEP